MLAVKSFLVLWAVLSTISDGLARFTTYNEYFNLNCTSGQSFHRFTSFHGSYDRSWSIHCKKIEPAIQFRKCEWSNLVNDVTDRVLFQCHNDAMLTGIFTIYFGSNYDRKYEFQCCEPDPSYVLHSCFYTGRLNTRYGNISYRIPDGWYLRGLYITAQYERDRTFYFQLCRIGKIELEQKDQC
ncbi:hemagglutinin/amebocyte aggregation factor [Biomphalaria glabrata]|nr:hemagglutinin/amebocyte aggregation factor [Biomphalaria glabrata]